MELQPVNPFEPIRVDEFPNGQEWVAQVKWDGVRVLTYFDGKEVRLFNRKLNERTLHYPELTNISTYSSANSVIYDGEIIALRDGRPSFYQVMKRDGLRRLDAINTVRKHVPITYMIFDVLYLNGRWVTSHSLKERQAMLAQSTVPTSHVQLVENFDDAEGLYNVIKLHDMEGIVLKDLTSTYLINGKDGRWRKKKFYRDLIAVVGGVTWRDHVVNSLLLGLFDAGGRLWYIGHAGTGRLNQKDWRQFTEVIKPLIQSTMPFAERPSKLTDVTWLKPAIAAKVKFAEWTEGRTLRQPSIQSFVNVDVHECRFE